MKRFRTSLVSRRGSARSIRDRGPPDRGTADFATTAPPASRAESSAQPLRISRADRNARIGRARERATVCSAVAWARSGHERPWRQSSKRRCRQTTSRHMGDEAARTTRCRRPWPRMRRRIPTAASRDAVPQGTSGRWMVVVTSVCVRRIRPAPDKSTTHLMNGDPKRRLITKSRSHKVHEEAIYKGSFVAFVSFRTS